MIGAADSSWVTSASHQFPFLTDFIYLFMYHIYMAS